MSRKQARIEQVRMEIREDQIPYFTDRDIEYYLDKYYGDVDRAIYDLLIIKSEDSSIKVSGWTTGDTSSYFKRLASKYRPSNSGMLKGV